MKRWFIATGLFVGGILITFCLTLYRASRELSTQRPTEVGFVALRVSPGAAIIVVMLLGILAIWLSAKLAR
jgi:hypothetical protein